MSEVIWFLFGGDEPERPLTLLQVMDRSVILLLIGICLVRIGKSRLLARATPVDTLMGFIIGSVLSRGMTGSASLSATVASTFALVFAHWVLTAATVRWHWFGNLIKGREHDLVVDGRLLEDNLRRSHISIDDLMEELRLNANVNRIEDVRLARKERSGEISVLKKARPPETAHEKIEPHGEAIAARFSPTATGHGA